MFSFPTILQKILADLPAIPDDIKQVEAEAAEFFGAVNGGSKSDAALKFAQTVVTVMRQVMGKTPIVWPAG